MMDLDIETLSPYCTPNLDPYHVRTYEELAERVQHLESFLPFLIQLKQAVVALAQNPMIAMAMPPQYKSLVAQLSAE